MGALTCQLEVGQGLRLLLTILPKEKGLSGLYSLYGLYGLLEAAAAGAQERRSPVLRFF